MDVAMSLSLRSGMLIGAPETDEVGCGRLWRMCLLALSRLVLILLVGVSIGAPVEAPPPGRVRVKSGRSCTEANDFVRERIAVLGRLAGEGVPVRRDFIQQGTVAFVATSSLPRLVSSAGDVDLGIRYSDPTMMKFRGDSLEQLAKSLPLNPIMQKLVWLGMNAHSRPHVIETVLNELRSVVLDDIANRGLRGVTDVGGGAAIDTWIMAPPGRLAEQYHLAAAALLYVLLHSADPDAAGEGLHMCLAFSRREIPDAQRLLECDDYALYVFESWWQMTLDAHLDTGRQREFRAHHDQIVGGQLCSRRWILVPRWDNPLPSASPVLAASGMTGEVYAEAAKSLMLGIPQRLPHEPGGSQEGHGLRLRGPSSLSQDTKDAALANAMAMLDVFCDRGDNPEMPQFIALADEYSRLQESISPARSAMVRTDPELIAAAKAVRSAATAEESASRRASELYCGLRDADPVYAEARRAQELAWAELKGMRTGAAPRDAERRRALIEEARVAKIRLRRRKRTLWSELQGHTEVQRLYAEAVALRPIPDQRWKAFYVLLDSKLGQNPQTAAAVTRIKEIRRVVNQRHGKDDKLVLVNKPWRD